jgi:hypothetical protein
MDMKKFIILFCIITGGFSQIPNNPDSLNARKKYSYVGDLSEHLYGGKGEFGCLDNLPVPSWFKGNTIVDIEVDCQGYIYIADKRNKRVMKYSKAGKFIWQTEGKILPLDVEVDKQGNLYVVEGPTVDILYDYPDDLTKGVYKFSADGKMIRHYISTIPQDWNTGTAAIKKNGEMVLIEGSNKKNWIKIFDQDFSILKKDTIYINNGPIKICIGDSQNIYLVCGSILRKLNADYQDIWSINLPLNYGYPNQSNIHIDYDYMKNCISVLFHANNEKNKSEMFIISPDGVITDTIAFNIKPYRFIISNQNGICYTALFDSSVVFIYDDKESLVTEVKSIVNFTGQYFRPGDIRIIDNKICIYDFSLGKKIFYDKFNHFLEEQKIIPEDTIKEEYPEVNFKKTEAPMRLRKCIKDDSERLYFLFSGYGGYHAIQIFDSDKHFIKEIVLPSTESLFSYEDIVISKNGYIFVTHSLGYILMYNINGEKIDEFGKGIFASEPVDCGSGLWRIAVDNENNIYAIDQIDNTIKKFAIMK